MNYNYFLAVVLDEATKNEIAQFGLAPDDARLQHTTPPHNLHITVGYIGPVAEDLLPKVAECFKALEALPPFTLTFKEIDFFGGRTNFKKYIGLTIGDPDENLKKVHQTSQDLLKHATTLNFRGGDREFKPHITFQLLKQRFKVQERLEFIKQTRKKFKHPREITVNTLGLWYRNPRTQRYESVCSYHLKGP